MAPEAAVGTTAPVQWLQDPGWRGRVGFISPPVASIDPIEFLRVAPQGFSVCQTMTYVPGFAKGLTTENIAQAAQQLENCCLALKEAQVDCIAQSGTPFSFVVADGLRFTRELHAKIEKMTGIPFVMMGLAVINSLKKLGLGSVAVACTYYTDDLAQKYTKFLEDAGIKVVAMEHFINQGLFANRQEVDRALFPPHSRIPIGLIYKAAKTVAKHAPKAEAVVISGGGVTTLDLLQPLEADVRKPVISSLSAQIWEILHRLEVHEAIQGRGTLLASLSERA